ncbi:MAG: glycosyl hydrolase family 18 protein [Sulfolobales archaeon]
MTDISRPRILAIIILMMASSLVIGFFIGTQYTQQPVATKTISVTYSHTYTVSEVLTMTHITSILSVATIYSTKTLEKTVTMSPRNLIIWAWIYSTNSSDVKEILSKYGGSVIDIVSPDWYYLTDDLGVGKFVSRGAEDPEFLKLVKDKNMLIIPMIVSSNASRVSRLISDLSAMERFSRILIDLASRNGYAGFNIDFEVSLPNQAKDFAYFLDYVAKRLHESKLILTVAIPAKRTEWPSSYTMTYDYELIGKSAVDYVMIMAYDYYESPGPKPVAPIWWVKDVIEYALKKIPREKLFLGVPNYGKIWSPEGRLVQWILYSDYQLLRQRGYVFNLDQNDQELVAKIDSNVAYYVDGELAYLRAKLAQEYWLPGVAIWRLDNGDPSTWDYLKNLKPCQQIIAK